MKNKGRSSSYCNNRRRQSIKDFCNFCKHFGYSFETCYHRNKSAVFVFTATVANTESGQPMAPVSAQSQFSGSNFTISRDDLSGIQEFKDFLSQQFEMKDLGHLSYFLGLEITHSTDELYITQAKYASELLSRAELTDSKIVDTPVELNVHLTPLGGKPLSNPSLYRCLVGSLVYLIITRPDISYVIHQVSQYLFAPRLTYYAAVLRILRYLKDTLFHGFFYSAQSPFILRAFSDAD